MSLSDFWHEGNNSPESVYDAIKVIVWHCGEPHCGIAIPHGSLRCSRGHKNNRTDKLT